MASSFTFNPRPHYLMYRHRTMAGTTPIMPGTAEFYWDPSTNVASVCILEGGVNTFWLEMSRASTTATTWIGTYDASGDDFAVFLTSFTVAGSTISGFATRIKMSKTPGDDQGSFVGIKR